MNKHLLTVLILGLSQISCTANLSASNIGDSAANPINSSSAKSGNIFQLMENAVKAGLVTPGNYEAMNSNVGSGLESSDPTTIGLTVEYTFAGRQPDSLRVDRIANDIEFLLKSYGIDVVFRKTVINSDGADTVINTTGSQEIFPYLYVRTTTVPGADIVSIEFRKRVIYSDGAGAFYYNQAGIWSQAFVRNYNVDEMGDDGIESYVKKFGNDYARANGL